MRRQLPTQGDRGTGTIGTAAGAAALLVFLLVGIQVCLHLAATTTVRAAGFDATRRVASRTVAHDDPRALRQAEVRAEARLRTQLGPMGRRAHIAWSTDGANLWLHLVVPAPTLLPAPAARRLGLGPIDAVFTARLEDPS